MSEETALSPHKTVLIVAAAVNPIEQDQQRRTVKNSNNLPTCRILWPPPMPNITTNWGFDFCEKNVLSKFRPCKIAATCIKVMTKKLWTRASPDKKTSSLTRLVFAMSADMMWSCTFNRCWGKQSWKYHVHQSSVNLNKVFCVFIGNDVVGTHRTCEPRNDHKQNEELWLVKMPSRLDVSGQLRCCNKSY